MTIPDPLIYTSIPTIAVYVAWTGRQFVLSTMRRSPLPQPRLIREEPDTLMRLSVRDYKELADTLRRELDGRYLEAKEARAHFASLSAKIDTIGEHLQIYVAEHGGHPIPFRH
jgi:hypothetical protein